MTVIPVVCGVFGTIPKDLKEDWKNWKLEESRLCRLQHC